MLLHGPVYHSGTQMLVSGDETHIKTQIEILKRTPIRSPADKTFVLQSLRALTTGYVAVTDSSMCQLVPELMELYPDAIVVCTIRDPIGWSRSMGELATTTTQTMLAIVLFWVPCLRYFPQWVRALHEGRWGELYTRSGEQPDYGKRTWDRHIDYLKRCVPSNRIRFYNVKDGWEPLCRILDVPIPAEDFPKVNDSAAMDVFAKKQIHQGLMRWALVLAASTTFGYIVRRLWVAQS